jgi:putative SOS response-associated peptidase YedK
MGSFVPRRPEDPWIRSCAMLTEPANYMVERFQPRMSVILHPHRWDAWMDPDVLDGSPALEFVLSDPSALRAASPSFAAYRMCTWALLGMIDAVILLARLR